MGGLHEPRGKFRDSASGQRQWLQEKEDAQEVPGDRGEGAQAAIAALDYPTRLPRTVKKLLRKRGKLQITTDFNLDS